jgi:hypothetical protein
MLGQTHISAALVNAGVTKLPMALQSSLVHEPPGNQSSFNPGSEATVVSARRVRLLRRSFVRKYLKRRPDRLESMALDRAAWLSALSEALSADPAVHADTVVRAHGAAARARRALEQLKPNAPSTPSLGELMTRNT